MHQNFPDRVGQNELAILTFEVNPSKEEWTDYLENLPTNEIAKSEEYHYSQDKLRFTKCRSILRSTLSKWLGKDPKTIHMTTEMNGKPYINEIPQIKFNITHTDGFAGIALCKDFEVGLDVENTTRATDIDAVSKKVFTDTEREKISSKKITNIHIQDPKVNLDNFSYIIAPEHDGLYGENVFSTKGAIHYLTKKEIENNTDYLKNKLNKFQLYLRLPLLYVVLKP